MSSAKGTGLLPVALIDLFDSLIDSRIPPTRAETSLQVASEGARGGADSKVAVAEEGEVGGAVAMDVVA